MRAKNLGSAALHNSSLFTEPGTIHCYNYESPDSTCHPVTHKLCIMEWT